MERVGSNKKDVIEPDPSEKPEETSKKIQERLLKGLRKITYYLISKMKINK